MVFVLGSSHRFILYLWDDRRLVIKRRKYDDDEMTLSINLISWIGHPNAPSRMIRCLKKKEDVQRDICFLAFLLDTCLSFLFTQKIIRASSTSNSMENRGLEMVLSFSGSCRRDRLKVFNFRFDVFFLLPLFFFSCCYPKSINFGEVCGDVEKAGESCLLSIHLLTGSLPGVCSWPSSGNNLKLMVLRE